MKVFKPLTVIVSLALATAAFAAPMVETSPTSPSPRLCYKLFTAVCTDCPGQTNFYCWPNNDGPFKSCTTLPPVQGCEDGYCAQVDLGPTGCQLSATQPSGN